MTDSVAEKGFTATVVADVVARAGVSRKTFYEHFRDRDDCFLQAYDDGLTQLREAMAATARALHTGDDPVASLRAHLRGYLDFLADRPALTRTFVLEVLTAGPEALSRRAASYDAFGQLTRAWHRRARCARPEFPEVPDLVHLAVVGAGHGLVAEEVRRGRTSQLRDLEPLLLYVHLALLADPATAATVLAEVQGPKDDEAQERRESDTPGR